MHGPVRIIGLHWSIDCRDLLLCHHHTSLRANFCKPCIFYAHNHKSRQAKLCKHTLARTLRQTPAALHPHTTYTDTHTKLVSFIPCWNEACSLSDGPHSGLSNPSAVGKTLCQPYSLNPSLSESSARLSVCLSSLQAPRKILTLLHKYSRLVPDFKGLVYSNLPPKIAQPQLCLLVFTSMCKVIISVPFRPVS